MAKKILLIEDEPQQIDIYEKVIKDAGIELETIRWGKEALKRLEEIKEKKKEKPDLILLDIILPDLNGVNILKKARTDPELKDLNFFVLTNYCDPDSEKLIQKLGVEKYILKTNITPSQLVKIIKQWFKN